MGEVNRTISKAIDGVKDAKENIGLRYKIAGIIDGDPEALVDVLDAANKGQEPRVTRNQLDAYIDDGYLFGHARPSRRLILHVPFQSVLEA